MVPAISLKGKGKGVTLRAMDLAIVLIPSGLMVTTRDRAGVDALNAKVRVPALATLRVQEAILKARGRTVAFRVPVVGLTTRGEAILRALVAALWVQVVPLRIPTDTSRVRAGSSRVLADCMTVLEGDLRVGVDDLRDTAATMRVEVGGLRVQMLILMHQEAILMSREGDLIAWVLVGLRVQVAILKARVRAVTLRAKGVAVTSRARAGAVVLKGTGGAAAL